MGDPQGHRVPVEGNFQKPGPQESPDDTEDRRSDGAVIQDDCAVPKKEMLKRALLTGLKRSDGQRSEVSREAPPPDPLYESAGGLRTPLDGTLT